MFFFSFAIWGFWTLGHTGLFSTAIYFLRVFTEEKKRNLESLTNVTSVIEFRVKVAVAQQPLKAADFPDPSNLL